MDLFSILQELMRYVYLPYLVFTYTETRLLDIITLQSIFGSSSELG
ncbi:hypothetical protein PanWU01x14_146550 [Parasponia andersonii]|uniref:Uncharacterized protein n=1 Tax=Parasponia andersonii TaxID=3476 RepID=A0A2P5CJQ9_PARAD|nr:hypothetical protein PanWU01x14_146550 [Parasponia andersonii]